MQSFSERLLAWYDLHGRKQLPWQSPRNPYRVWLSEIMLQQTQVATVIPYFERFLEAFPDVQTLASAELDEVLALWAGLGYYARARNLHACAQQICARHAGIFPNDVDQLAALPGIGRSTAGAIVAQAYDEYAVILDGNVKRVLARHERVDGWPGQSKVQRQLWRLAEARTPRSRLADYTQAIMDLGAMICRRSRPECYRCPVSADCRAFTDACIEDYPVKKTAAKVPVRHAQMLLILRGQRLWLEKRPPQGIWGGLWSLPELEDKADVQTRLIALLGSDEFILQTLPGLSHRFSHFQLDIRPWKVELLRAHDCIMESGGWVDLSDLEGYGLPRPVQKIIENITGRQ